MKSKNIRDYCSRVEGWVEFPLNMIYNDYELQFNCSFINELECMQMICDLRDNNLHISISPVMSFGPKVSREELVNRIVEKAPEILRAFFGNFRFERLPDSKHRSDQKHYMVYFYG